jgi:FtsP/CotA-like multicopper oxidase with cupredoxin domain
VNFGAAGMIIVEDAINQLPVEFDPKVMEDYIVATYHVVTDDITKLTNDYIKNCICINKAVDCFGESCSEEPMYSSGKLSSWNKQIKNSSETCANNEFDILCLQVNCNIPTTDEDQQHARDCVSQAQFFFANPDGFEHESAELLLTNGQHEPTLTIEADTWVRLRLGYMSTQNYLRAARHSNTLRTCWVRHN